MKVMFKSLEELMEEFEFYAITTGYVINGAQISLDETEYLGKVVEGYYDEDNNFIVDYDEIDDFWGKFPSFVIKDEVIEEIHTYKFKSGNTVIHNYENIEAFKPLFNNKGIDTYDH